MMRRATLLLGLALVGCGGERALPAVETDTPARRIVSLDFCADQYVLKLADRADILALSSEAVMDHSYLRAEAEGLRRVRPLAEDALALEPDLIVRSYGGGPNAQVFFERAGVRVLNVGWAGDLDAVKRVTREMAAGLGQGARGEALVAEMDARIDALPSPAGPARRRVLYMTPTGVTSGRGTLVDELLSAAGLSNFETREGWHSLPLERLTRETPDRVATSFYDIDALGQDIWSAARHPVARRQIEVLPVTELSGAWTACGAWFVLDAAEALAGAATDVEAE